MIPLIQTDSTGTPAAVELASPPQTAATEPPFATTFLLGEVADVEVAPDTTTASLEGEVSLPAAAVEPEVEGASVPPLAAKPTKETGAELLSGPTLQPTVSRRDSTARVVSGQLSAGPPTEEIAPELSKTTSDQSIRKEGSAPSARASSAQSAIESLFPKSQPPLQNSDAPRAAVGLPPGRGVDSASAPNIIRSETPASQSSTQATTAAKGVPLGVDHVPRSRRDDHLPQLERMAMNSPQSNAMVAQIAQPPAVALVKDTLVAGPVTKESLGQTVEAAHSLGASVGERSAAFTTATGQGMPAAHTEIARNAATQIAVAVTNHPNKTTEIALNPEELGRVRLTMTAVDGVMTLHLNAERADTQDLLRRHIEALAQEFRDLGYDTISFSFGDEDQAQPGQHNSINEDESAADTTEIETAETQPIAGAISGLDLRL